MEYIDTPLMKRIKSLGWRVGAMTLAFFVATLSDNLGMLELNPTATMFLGLVLGELSKYLNKK